MIRPIYTAAALVALLIGGPFMGACSRSSSTAPTRTTRSEGRDRPNVDRNSNKPEAAVPLAQRPPLPAAAIADESDPALNFIELLNQTDVLPTTDAAPQSAREHLQMRQELDRTVWSTEVDAQRHEDLFVQLWDNLRYQTDKFAVLKDLPFRMMELKWPGEPDRRELGIRIYGLDQPQRSLTPDQWRTLLDNCQQQGYRLVQSEWHHAKFQRLGPESSQSSVNFAVDLERESPQQRLTVRGELHVVWSDEPGKGSVPNTISTANVEVLVRDGPAPFREILIAQTDDKHKRLMPLIVHDLNGDGRSDILLGGLNRIYFNQGQGRFRQEPICPQGLDIFDAAVLADFTGDGCCDLISVQSDRHPQILEGNEHGRFSPPRRCADFYLEFPKSFTAGDIDADGDLDLWIGQYKFPYVEGSMPSPYYDANDGYPAVLLRNDGKGNFTDITEQAGLTHKRHRRTFSSSLVDLDDDGDLDLLVVSDFSGVDIYENDGQGYFVDVTDRLIDERHLFGMAHSLADFDLDGLLDMYVIGMSSTTARRLDYMNAGRTDHSDINQMRKAMGYGNRMYVARAFPEGRRYVRPGFADAVARTGWSWGTTAWDFDNDGDKDIYVANGHNSGRSARDYCTRYWCHDVYTGSSAPNEELFKLFGVSLRPLHEGEISWNGYEHNVLLMNESGRGFLSMAFLLGLAFEFDGRGVVSDDLDADGRPDLLVVEYQSERRGHAEYTLHVLRNELETGHHWIGIRFAQHPGQPSPLGAKVTLTYGRGTQVAHIVTGDSFSSQHAPVVHFGLGQETRVRSIHVRWLDGTERRLAHPQVDTYHTIDST